MAYLSDDELLDTEGGFTGWDDGTGAGAEETLEQALAEERLAELESELEQDEHPIDYEAELEDEEEEAAPVSEKRLKREMRAEAIRRLEEAARTEKDFRAVVEEWNKLDRNRERRERDHENLRGDVPLEYQAVPEPKLIPRWMNNPAYRQLMAGNFLDILFDCPYEMHNLTADPFISRMVEELSEEHKEVLYFLSLRLYSTTRLAAVRGQSDRNIRKLRKEAGYTQEDVSRKLNIQRQTYCNYENGTRMPPLEIIIALADLYKLSVDALVRDGTPVLSPEPPQLTSYQATTIQTFLTLSEEKQKEAGDFIRFKHQLCS